jgi:hypothetical protein
MPDFIRLLPAFWFQNRKTSFAWDKALNRALDLGVSYVGAHTATVGPFEVWVSNYPYAFGYNTADALESVPRCSTRIRLRKAIEQWQEDEYMRQFQ